MMGNRLGAGMRPVDDAETVLDEDVGQFGELGRESVVVGFFFGVETQVFEQQDLTRLDPGGGLGGGFADAISRELDRSVKNLLQALGDREQAAAHVALAVRAPKVRTNNQFDVVVEQILDGRQGLFDAVIVGDLTVVERHVVVGAQQDGLTGQIDVFDCFFCKHSHPNKN